MYKELIAQDDGTEKEETVNEAKNVAEVSKLAAMRYRWSAWWISDSLLFTFRLQKQVKRDHKGFESMETNLWSSGHNQTR